MSLTFNMVSGNYGDIPTPTEKTVSGAVVHITDALRRPAIALSTAINPVQDLHGYNAPWPAGGGKNLFKPIDTPITKDGVTIEMTADGEFWVHGTPTIQSSYIVFDLYTFTFTPALDKTVTISINEKTVGVGLILGSGNGNLNLTLSDTVTSRTGTYTQGTGQVQINVRYDVGTIDKKYKIQLEISGSATAWTPYSNVCPISGFSAANIVVSPTTTAGDGTTYSVSFGAAGTVYGGTLDVTTGTLTIDHQMFLFDGSDTSNWTVNANNYFQRRRPTGFSETTSESWPKKFYSNALETTTRSGSAGNIQFNSFYAGSTYLAVRIDSFNHDLTTFQNFLTNTGLQILVPIEEETVQLTPTEVQMLLGTNNVWSDTNGDVTLTYLADGRVNSLTALNMLLGGAYTPSADVTDREALQIIMGESE